MKDKIIEYLIDEGLFFWCNTSAIKNDIGLPVITVMLPNNHLYIEVDRLTGRQRDKQEAFQCACKINNHHYIIARCVADVRAKIKELI